VVERNKLKAERLARLTAARADPAEGPAPSDAMRDDPAVAGGADSPKQLLWRRPGFLVRRLHQIHVAMFLEECASHPVTPVQLAVLTTLSVLPGLDQVSIGHEVGLDRTTTADVVKRLEDNGLLTRMVHPVDKRARQVFLTPAGERVVSESNESMTRAQDRLLAPLKPAERAMFMQLLSTLVEVNNQYSRTTIKALL
jgi:DNA-binding MarR family transcriptional regulator